MDVKSLEQRYLANEGLRSDIQTQQLYDNIAQLEDEKDLLKTTLDSSQLIIDLENKLRGRIQLYDERAGTLKWEQLTEPVMNDEGINAVLQEVMIRATRDQILANLDAEEVRARMSRLVLNLTLMIMAKSNAFKIDKLRRSNVCDMIEGIVHNHMTRSIGRAEGRDVYGRTKAIEHLQRTTGSNEDKSWSIFGKRRDVE